MPQLPSQSGSHLAAAGAREDCWGLVASSIVHVAAIAALGCVFLPVQPPRTPPAVATVWTVDADRVQEELPDVELVRPQSARAGGRFSVAAAISPAASVEPIVHLVDRVPQELGPLVSNVDLRQGVALTSAASNGTGNGTGVGQGDGAGRGVGFFPVEQPTGRFVFVVDASKSMNHRYPGPAKTRLGRVKVELWRTIYEMSPEQKFFIVFFDTHAKPMPSTTLRDGGRERQADLFNWTASVRAEGKTDPQQALLMAMQMQPDVIFFLTDGEFNYKVVREVTKANFGGVKIHSISLGDDAGAEFLTEIAAKNGGTYRHIIEEDDHYWTDEPETAAVTASGDATVPVRDDSE